MAEDDPGIALEPTPAESENGQDKGLVNEFGQGLFEPDKRPGELADAGAGQPDEPAEEAAESSADKPSTDDVPEDAAELRAGYLRDRDYRQKTMQHAEQVRAFEARQQAFEEQQAQFRAQQQEWLTYQQQAAPLEAEEFDNRAAMIAQIMQNPELDPQTRAGLGVIHDMAAELEDAFSELDELRQFRDQIQGQIQETTQTVSTLNQQQQAEVDRKVRLESEAAVERFGQETVGQQWEFVKRNYGYLTDPETGNPYTIAELVALGSQKPLQAARQAIEGNRAAANQAKQAVRPQGSQVGSEPQAGALTEAQAIEQIRQTMMGA